MVTKWSTKTMAGYEKKIHACERNELHKNVSWQLLRPIQNDKNLLLRAMCVPKWLSTLNWVACTNSNFLIPHWWLARILFSLPQLMYFYEWFLFVRLRETNNWQSDITRYRTKQLMHRFPSILSNPIGKITFIKTIAIWMKFWMKIFIKKFLFNVIILKFLK